MSKASVVTMEYNRRLVISLAIYCFFIGITSGQVIEIEDGLIEGRLMESRSGIPFNAFLGIPFAEPPTGELRFLPPVAKRPWDGVLNCTTFGPICVQGLFGPFESEDCLQLNVFTKNLPSNETVGLKPVIAYIHGGGFEAGTAINHGPEYLMDRDIILVTLQYRLGAFGFMGVGTANVSGNQGLKDQSVALRWIHNNIHHFGGDRNRVTISGLSAGSISATAHIVSPMSQGLFHNVIGLSGSIASQIRPVYNNTATVEILARRVNCTIETIDSMITCLRNTSAQAIAQNMRVSTFPCLIFSWTPILEPDLGQQRFITDDPNVLFREGNFTKVNVLMGITSHEFIQPAASVLYNPNATIYLNENWNEIAPICFYFQGNEFRTTEQMATTLKQSYFPFDIIDIRSFNNLNNLFADSIISYGVHKLVHLINAFTDVYYYVFSYVGQYSSFNFPRTSPYGVHHGDDNQYLFNYQTPNVMINLTHPDSFVVERMTRIWERFAWSGNPNNQTEEERIDNMIWPKHDNATEWYLDIGNHLVEKNGLFLERFTIWDNFERNTTTNSTSHTWA